MLISQKVNHSQLGITMAAIAISSLISFKDMESLVEQEMTYQQISVKLRIKHCASKGLSSMSVRRFCRKINNERNCKWNKKELMKEVFQWTSEVNYYTVISIFEKINLVYWKLTNPLFFYITHCIKDPNVLKTGNTS